MQGVGRVHGGDKCAVAAENDRIGRNDEGRLAGAELETHLAEEAREELAVFIGDLYLGQERAGGGIEGTGDPDDLAGKNAAGEFVDHHVDREAGA